MGTLPSLPSRGIEVFYSYAHTDERLRNALDNHLSLLKRQGVITDWHDRRITAGTEWAGAIDAHLQRAQIILLLVSADFLASDYCYGVEVQQAMARHEAGEARVIPIILRAVDWQSAPFGKLQALPKDGRPITSWPNQDEAFHDVARSIRAVAEGEHGARDGDWRKGNRRDLLDDVKREIADRLAQSLHHEELIPLHKELQPRQVSRPWDVEVIVDTREPTQLPPETATIEVFDREVVAGRLLILGAPGAGKTTELLQLARELIGRAEAEPGAPIPVLVNLSSWQDDDQPLATWLVDELTSKYGGVRRDIYRQWLEERRLSLLLDGLDELEGSRQTRGVQAINQFQHDYRPAHLVVCCRAAEYEHCETKLQLNGAIYLHPLTAEQIHAYLSNAELLELWHSVQADRELSEMATSPLLLSLLIVAFEETTRQAWRGLHSAQERRHYLFQSYIHRMLSRAAPGQTYAREQTLRWLSALATMLHAHGQDEFLLEKLQPTWLPSRVQRWGYHAGVVLIVALITGVATWLHGKLLTWLPKGPLSTAVVDWITRNTDMESIPDTWFTIPLGVGLGVGLLIGLRREIRPVETMRWSSANAWDGMVQGWRRAFPTALRYGVYFGIIAGMIAGVLYFLSENYTGLLDRQVASWRSIEQIAGAISMVIAGVVAILIVRSWRWRRGGFRHRLTSVVTNAVIKWLIAGGVAGIGTGLIVALITGVATWAIVWLLSGLSIGVSVGVSVGLAIELLSRLRGTTQAVGPIQGMRPGGWRGLGLGVSDGLKTGAKMGVISSLVVGILVSLGVLDGSEDIRKVLAVAFLPLLILITISVFFLLNTLAGVGTGIGVGALLVALFGALHRGLTGPDIVRRTAPNQGIRQSAINMGLFALVGGLTVGVIWGLVNMSVGMLTVRVAPTTADWMRYVLWNVVIMGTFSALVPGAACLQHFTLRFILWCSGRAPWRYARFLDHATERRLLQRVGGRYRFIHDLLRDHFAAMEPIQAKRS